LLYAAVYTPHTAAHSNSGAGLLSQWMITVYDAVTGLNRAAGYSHTARRMGTHCGNRRGVLIFFGREYSHRLAYMPSFVRCTPHTAAYIISGADLFKPVDDNRL